MEKLIYMVIAGAIVTALVLGFLAGAVGNLFGFGFWQPAILVGAIVSAWWAARIWGGN